MSYLPFAAPEDFSNGFIPKNNLTACWFIFSKDELLIGKDKKTLPSQPYFVLDRNLYIGSSSLENFFAGEIKKAKQPPEGWIWCSLRTLYKVLDKEHFSMAGRAMQWIHWDQTHLFCGCCGGKTFPRQQERSRECLSCGHLSFPKLAPVAMVLVRKGKQILLARGPHFPEKFFSVLAGYVDPGETLEQCVFREVQEEVGIKIKNIQYFGSQPWPFSNSLIMGFICDWEEGEITIDPLELEAADWFDLSHLPQLPPPLSIARMLIDSQIS